MNFFYTILFFVNTLVLIVLVFSLLKMIDTGMHAGTFFLMISAILLSVILLVYLLLNYIKFPPSDIHH